MNSTIEMIEPPHSDEIYLDSVENISNLLEQMSALTECELMSQ